MNRISAPLDLSHIGLLSLIESCQDILFAFKKDHQVHLNLYNQHLKLSDRSQAFMQTFKTNLERTEQQYDYFQALIKRLQNKHYQIVLGTLLESTMHAKEHADPKGRIQYPYGFIYLSENGKASANILLIKSKKFNHD